MQTSSQAVLFHRVLAAATGAEASVLFFVTDPFLRLGLGLLALLPILWAAPRVPVVEHAARLISRPFRPRRFLRLRSLVSQLLEEISRLNWTAVDGARGVRDQEETLRLMNALEHRLRERIALIRGAAGVEEPQEGVSGEVALPNTLPEGRSQSRR